jgi:hypothetical protein
MFTETKRNIADRLSILSIHDEIENEVSNNLETEARICIDGGMSTFNPFHNTEVSMKTWILTTPSDSRKGIAVAALFQYFNENGTLKVPIIKSTYYGIIYSDIRQLQWVRPNIKSWNDSENKDPDLSSDVRYIPCLELPYDQKVYTDEGFEKIIKTGIDDGTNYTEYTRNAIEEYVKIWDQMPDVISSCDKEGQIPVNDLESVDIEDLIYTCLIGDRKPKLDIEVAKYSEYLYKHFNRKDNRYDIDDDTKEIIETAINNIITSTAVPFYQDFNAHHYYVNKNNHVVYDPNRDNNSSTN